MNKLIDSFSQLNVTEKSIINKIVSNNNNSINSNNNNNNNNNNIDELIDSFDKLNIDNISEIINSFDKINITENLQKTICNFIDLIKLLKNKEKCNSINNMNYFIPQWLF